MNREYELSLWRDYPQNGILREEKVLIIANNEMTHTGRAQNIVLTEKSNDDNELTFELPINYFNALTQTYEQNKFATNLVNESKVKLKLKKKWYNVFTKEWEDYKWFDFIVKNRTQKRSKGQILYSYTCKNLLNDQLSSSGYDIELTEDDGVGTAHELARIVLSGSDWEYIQTEVFPEQVQDYDPLTGETKLIPVKTNKLDLIHNYKGSSLYANCYTYTPSQFKRDGTLNPHYNGGAPYEWANGRGGTINYIYGYGSFKLVTSYCEQNQIVPGNNFTSTAGWEVSDPTVATLEFNYTKDSLGEVTPYLSIKNESANSIYLYNKYNSQLSIGKYFICKFDYESNERPNFGVYNGVPNRTNTPLIGLSDVKKENDIDGAHSYWFYTSKNISNPYFGIEIKGNDTFLLYGATLFSMTGADESIGEELYKTLSVQPKYSGELIGTDLVLPIDSNLTYIQSNYYTKEGIDYPIYLLPNEIVQNNYQQDYTTYFIERYQNGSYIVEELDINGTLSQLSGYDYDKRKLVTVSKSNRFNILESIAEKFSIFIKVLVEHNEDGSIKTYQVEGDDTGQQIKKVTFSSLTGMNQYHGFTYGVNLADVTRTIDSMELVSKMYVEDKDSEITDTGLMSIRESVLNPIGESFLYDFNYYIHQGLLEETSFNRDYVPFKQNLKLYNKEISTGAAATIDLTNRIQASTVPEYVARISQAALLTAAANLVSPFWAAMNRLLQNAGQLPFSSDLRYMDIERQAVTSSYYDFEVYNEQALEYYVPNEITEENLPIVGQTVIQPIAAGLPATGYVTNVRGYISTFPLIANVDIWNPSYNYYFAITIDDQTIFYHFTIDKSVSAYIEYHKDSNSLYLRDTSGGARQRINVIVNSSPLTGYVEYTDVLQLVPQQLIVIYSQSFSQELPMILNYHTTCTLEESLNLVLGNEELAQNNYYEVLVKYANQYKTYTTQINEYDKVLYGEINPVIQFTKNETSTSRYYFNFMTKNKIESQSYQIQINGTFYQVHQDNGFLYISYTVQPSFSLLTDYTITQYRESDLITKPALVFGDESYFNKDDTATLQNQYNAALQKLSNLYVLKTTNIAAFERKYARFIRQGSYSGEGDYTTSDEYCLDALRVLETSSMPKVSYTINAVDLSRYVHPFFEAEWGEDFEYNVGDNTYISDPELFGYSQITRAPIEQKVTISEISTYVDIDKEDKITIKNYDTRFEELFSRIAASVISLSLNEDIYARAGAISPTGAIDSQILQDSFNQNSDLAISGLNGGYSLTQQDGLILGANSINRVHLNDKGVFLTNDGGLTWTLGITSQGINGETIKTGTIDTSQVSIVNGDQKNYIMDARGLTAYKPGSNNQFIRFDQYGLYFTKQGNEFEEGWDSGFNSGAAANKIQNLSNVSITWDGFCYNGAPGLTGSKVLIGDTKQQSSQGANCIIYTNNGAITTFSLDEEGNLFARGRIQATSGYIGNDIDGFEIRGFDPTETGSKPSALFNRNKDTLDNTSVGVYMGNDGFNLGDADTYIKADYTEKTITVRGLDSNGSFSDRKLKKDISELPEHYEKIIDYLTPVLFRFINGKSGRFHTGLIAQDVAEALAAAGISIDEYGLICINTHDGKESWTIRYEEIIPLLIKKVQSLQAQLDHQAAQIQELFTLVSNLNK